MITNIKTQRMCEQIEERYNFTLFPDFNQQFPNQNGDMFVLYNDGTPLGKYHNVKLNSYYLSMCKNAENINRINQIVIIYDKEYFIEIPEEKVKSKQLF